MKRLLGNLAGVAVLAIPSLHWLADFIGLASLPDDLKTWGIVFATMFEDPWLYGPAALGLFIILAVNIPAIRFWGRGETEPSIRFIPFWKFSSFWDNPVLFRCFIPLKHAAEIAYKKTESCLVARFAEAHARELYGGDKNGILEYYANYLAGSRAHKATLFGYRPPATRLEEIDTQYVRSGTFRDGGNTIIQQGDPLDVTWSPVWVMAKDLWRRSRELN